MGSDRARRSYDATRMYRSIVSQQGRVTVEADANEGEDIRAEEARARLIDVIGPTGAPANGFKISVPAGGGPSDFAIGAGALYVGGLRVMNANPEATYVGQRQSEWVDYPAGHLDEPSGPLTELVFLALTEREVSAVEDPALREPALGGPDTAARTRLVQHVKRYPLYEGATCEGGFGYVIETGYGMAANFAGANMQLTSRARLRVDFVPTAAGTDLCQPTAQPGFLGADNQLIRVQVSERVENKQTFLWGWDNASFLYRVTIPTPTLPTAPKKLVKLEGIPVDVFHQPGLGQRVELLGTAVDLGGGAYVASETGMVFEVQGYDATERTVTLKNAIPDDFLAKHPKQLFIRIWENQLAFAESPGIPVELIAADGTSTGVVIHAEAISWVPGDYWMIGVRPSTPTAILPARLAASPQPPDGPRRWLAPLAVIDWPATGDPTVSDCRPLFLDLVELTQRKGGGCCELVVSPGEDIQNAINSLPAEGGSVCLKAGRYVVVEPIQINRSNVVLHGEIPGTVVQYGPAGGLAVIGGTGAAAVSGIVVRDIQFSLNGFGGKPPLSIEGVRGIRVERCGFGAAGHDTSPATGVSIRDSQGVELLENTIGTCTTGIYATLLRGRFVARNNTIRGIAMVLRPAPTVTVNMPLGQKGIWVDPPLVPGAPEPPPVTCEIEGNRIADFVEGIRLGPATIGAVVRNNRVVRDFTGAAANRPGTEPSDVAALRTYLDGLWYGIDASGRGSLIEGNEIPLSTALGGIRVRVQDVRVRLNVLAAADRGAEQMLPGGIYCRSVLAPAPGGVAEVVDRCEVSQNRLDGPQAAIVLSGINGAELQGNRIESFSSRGWYGVCLDHAVGATVSAHRCVRTNRAVFLAEGEQNRVLDNTVSNCSLGVVALNEADLEVRGNSIVGAESGALALVPRSGACLVSHNHIANCGWRPFLDLDLRDKVPFSIAVLGLKAILSPSADLNVTIDSCEVIDTGIAPGGGKTVEETGAYGIWAQVPACQVTRCRVAYTNASLLDAKLEHRALHLSGPVFFRAGTGGAAMVSNNLFHGPGRTHLVELPAVRTDSEVGFRFEQVGFSHNQCEHVTPGEGRATVQLSGENLIIIGNHIKAPVQFTGVSARAGSRTTLLGNISTGAYDVSPTTLPAQITDFNF